MMPTIPEVIPAEPIVVPETKPATRPKEDDPFYFPQPLIDPTPKAELRVDSFCFFVIFIIKNNERRIYKKSKPKTWKQI